MFGAFQRFVNRLLPFATPGTPLIQDLLHLAALCTALYYAPQIQAWYQARPPPDDDQQEHHVDDIQNQDGTHDQDVDPAGAGRQVPRGVIVEDGDEDEQPEGRAAEPDGPLFPGAEPEQGPEFGDGEAEGVAGPAGPRPTPSSRTVGAKKAKSLARKDQRRAYHEFMRSQGEAQRAQEAEGAREREAMLAEERARRAAVEVEVEARRAKEREEKREREMKAQREEMARRERAVALVRQQLRESGMCNTATVAAKIGGGADRIWIENLVKASGLSSESRSAEAVSILTETGWVVQVLREDMLAVYARILETGSTDHQGRVSGEDLDNVLQSIIQNRVKLSA